jgi:hypothetical protein
MSVEINMIAMRARSVTTCVELIVQTITTQGYLHERSVWAISPQASIQHPFL